MGSFYIDTWPTKKGVSWRLMIQTFRKGERSQDPVEEPLFSQKGFKVEMSVEEARALAKLLNRENRLKAEELRSLDASKSAAATNLKRITKITSIYLPTNEHTEFIEYLGQKRFGSEQNRKRVASHWNMAQKFLTHLKMFPQSFYIRADDFYDHAIDLSLSLDYVLKIRRVTNLWGSFLSEKQNANFKPLPPPDSLQRNQIIESYEGSDNFQGASAPLTETELQKLEEKFKDLPGQWNFLRLTVYFGLRPSECDWLKKGDYTLEFDKSLGVDVLTVYQAKLVRLPKENRYKFLPLFLPQQKDLKDVINSGNFNRPLTKTVQSYTGNHKITLYGGRRNFTDMMLDYDQKLEDISAWMGHSSIEKTWKVYRNKKRVAFTPMQEPKISLVKKTGSD